MSLCRNYMKTVCNYSNLFVFTAVSYAFRSIGIKIVMDAVPNHTSHKHEWFIKSVQRVEPFTDYYVWADAKYINETRHAPNNWVRNKQILKLYIPVNVCL